MDNVYKVNCPDHGLTIGDCFGRCYACSKPVMIKPIGVAIEPTVVHELVSEVVEEVVPEIITVKKKKKI